MSWFSKSLDEEIEQLYRAESQGIFRSIMARGGSREAALDMVQTAFIKVYTHILQTKNRKNLKSLLYTTALNCFKDEMKKKKAESLEELQEEGVDVASGLRADEAAQVHLVRELLAHVDEAYREVVTYKVLDGLSPREIAAMLNLSSNVVSVRLYRGMKQLRELYKNKG